LSKLKSHWTLLIVTHDASDLLSVADRFWTLDHGDLQEVDRAKLEAKETSFVSH
jgi:energy-coupling factor transport system ATP-binding protein